MAAAIRQLNGNDSARWLDLLETSVGEDYPDQQVYQPDWLAPQLEPLTGHETWAAEVDGRLHGSVSFLQPASQIKNPVLNLGRQLFRPESFRDGSAEALLRRISELAAERGQILVARVLASDTQLQQLHEKLDYF